MTGLMRSVGSVVPWMTDLPLDSIDGFRFTIAEKCAADGPAGIVKPE